QQAAQSCQDATVAEYNPAGVLGTKSALQRRLAEVAQLCKQADGAGEPERLLEGEPPEEDRAAKHGDEHGAGNSPGRALDGLARADRRKELPPAVGAPREIP